MHELSHIELPEKWLVKLIKYDSMPLYRLAYKYYIDDNFSKKKFAEFLDNNITAVFAVSDHYALDFMHFLQEKGIKIPDDIQMIGFDDNAASRESRPALTTIRQDPVLRAKSAIECIEAMRDGRNCEEKILLPVELIKRESTRELSCQNL